MSQILLIDSYDSFTHNLRALISKTIPDAHIHTIYNDCVPVQQFKESFAAHIASNYDCIIIGPGPGDPNDRNDTLGIVDAVVSDKTLQNVPMLGICLGWQAMGLAGMAEVERLKDVKHGQIAQVFKYEKHNIVKQVKLKSADTKGENSIVLEESSISEIFEDIDAQALVSDELLKDIPTGFNSVRYHSLHVVLPSEIQSCDILPLAYTIDPELCNGHVLMAGKHKARPFYGVQYHPESICSEYGGKLIENFYKFSQKWNKLRGRNITGETDGSGKEFEKLFVNSSLREDEDINHEFPGTKAVIDESIAFEEIIRRKYSEDAIQFIKLDFPITNEDKQRHTAIELIDSLKKQQTQREDYFLLSSSAEPKSWSIIGVAEPKKSLEITWSLNDSSHVGLNWWTSSGNNKKPYNFPLNGGSIWTFLQNFMSNKLILGSHKLRLPFIGGLIGSISYESGQYIDVDLVRKQRQQAGTKTPDIKMIFVERSIIYNEQTGELYIISLKSNDQDWLKRTSESVNTFSNDSKQGLASTAWPHSISDILKSSHDPQDIIIRKPSQTNYMSLFHKCQEYLHAGDSYELCLCTPTTISFPHGIDPWELYKLVTLRNPAPHSGFLQFGDMTLVSSSPERFFSWKNDYDRGTEVNKDFIKVGQLRPIKGTLRKREGLTRDQAQELLNDPKELGENLMIVDLIRHDLYSHCDSDNNNNDCSTMAKVTNVRVPKLMIMEEYKTVYQLVSVIECDILSPTNHLASRVSRGFQILSTSLPPGSMTGAPKKRSVQLLQNDLESSYGQRGIYSGVFGYWSMDDQADWSVVIRSMFSYDKGLKDWRIGAGGAITVLSTDIGEWEEMNVKLDSILQIFK